MTRARLYSALAAFVLVASCAPAPPPSTDAREEQAARPVLTSRYKGVAMGVTIKGTTLDVSVDADALISMDEDAEDAMKQNVPVYWKNLWTQNHPQQHAALHVAFIDFLGKVVYSTSLKTPDSPRRL